MKAKLGAHTGTHTLAEIESLSVSAPVAKPLTVTVKNARQITGLGTTTLYDLIAKDIIDSFKIGNRRLIVFASLERLASLNSLCSQNPAQKATAARIARRVSRGCATDAQPISADREKKNALEP